jgi:hypothetical protein
MVPQKLFLRATQVYAHSLRLYENICANAHTVAWSQWRHDDVVDIVAVAREASVRTCWEVPRSVDQHEDSIGYRAGDCTEGRGILTKKSRRE